MFLNQKFIQYRKVGGGFPLPADRFGGGKPNRAKRKFLRLIQDPNQLQFNSYTNGKRFLAANH